MNKENIAILNSYFLDNIKMQSKQEHGMQKVALKNKIVMQMVMQS